MVGTVPQDDRELWSVDIVSVGSSLIAGPEVFWMSHWNEVLPLAFNVAVIRRGDTVMLVNTSPPVDTTSLEEEFPAMRYLHDVPRGDLVRESGEQLFTELRTLGIAPEDVDYVLLTPLEQYTTGTLSAFTRAQICMTRRGWVHFHTTHEHPHDSRWRSFSRETLVDLVTESWSRVRLLEDEDEVLPGVRTWWSGAHHRESMVVEVDTERGTVAVSDAFFYFENVEENRLLGLNESMEETLATNARVRRTADLLVPIHDPKVFDRYPGGAVSSMPSA